MVFIGYFVLQIFWNSVSTDFIPDPPNANPVVQQIPNGAIIASNTVRLLCTASGGNPLPTLSWDCTGTYTNNTSGNTASYSVELNVDKTYNNRICTCAATHPDTSYRPRIQHKLEVYCKLLFLFV